MFYALIFIATICLNNSLNSMELFKKKKSAQKTTKSNHCHSIINDIFFIKNICHNYVIAQDIGDSIQQYSLLLRKKYFEQNFSSLYHWNDFRIPLAYQYLLTPSQIKILQTLFTEQPFTTRFGYSQCSMQHHLPSTKAYNEFLTLPIELRRCLTKLPISEINKQKEYNTRNNRTDNISIDGLINKHAIIQVKKKSPKIGVGLTPTDPSPEEPHYIYWGYKPKFIVPEEKSNKKTKNKKPLISIK